MRLAIIPLFFLLATTAMAEPNPLPGWALGPFERPEGVNPVIAPQGTRFDCPVSHKPVTWEANDTFNPAAIVKDGKIYVFYRAEDMFGKGIGGRTSRIGLAESSDGIHFTRRAEPVLFPAEDDQKANEWPGGCEDPRIVEREDGTYVMAYTQWNRQVPRLAIATSKDLIHWTKHGPAFATAHGGRFKDQASKSGSILTRLAGDRLITAKIDGKYIMFGGESPAYLCTSDDCIAWTPVLNDKGGKTNTFAPRQGTFFSLLTEPGPPALLTDQGIVLMYNGKNAAGANGDQRFNAGVYAAGQVLIDPKNPAKALDWLKVPFFRPMLPYEASGQYAAGTVFIEGLVHFQKKWFLYYGCADSRVSVAVWDPAKPGQADPLPEPPAGKQPGQR
jgi:predicted GH43/DUF377 family glycosyl hydrolase